MASGLARRPTVNLQSSRIAAEATADQAHTAVGRGVLFRLLVGEPLRALLTDDDLVLLLGLNAPTLAGAR